MSSLAPLEAVLQRYQTLAFHQNPALADRLQQIQAWQKQRMQDTHQTLFARYPAMARYFLNRLYGGAEIFEIKGKSRRI